MRKQDTEGNRFTPPRGRHGALPRQELGAKPRAELGTVTVVMEQFPSQEKGAIPAIPARKTGAG